MKNRYSLGWSKSNGTITIDSKCISNHENADEVLEAREVYAKLHGFKETVMTYGTIAYKKDLEYLHIWDNLEEQ